MVTPGPFFVVYAARPEILLGQSAYEE